MISAWAKKLEAKIERRVHSLIRRGQVAATDTGGGLQLDGYQEELIDEVEQWQQYGFASRPPAGSEVLWVNLGGRGERPIAVATNNRGSRPDNLEASEVRIYSDGKVCVESEDLRLGSSSASESAIHGDAMVSALNSYATAVNAALTSIPTFPGAAKTALDAATANFQTSIAAAKSSTVKVN